MNSEYHEDLGSMRHMGKSRYVRICVTSSKHLPERFASKKRGKHITDITSKTNISFPKVFFLEDDFPFPKGGGPM